MLMNFMMRNLFFHVDSECYEDLVIKIKVTQSFTRFLDLFPTKRLDSWDCMKIGWPHGTSGWILFPNSSSAGINRKGDLFPQMKRPPLHAWFWIKKEMTHCKSI